MSSYAPPIVPNYAADAKTLIAHRTLQQHTKPYYLIELFNEKLYTYDLQSSFSKTRLCLLRCLCPKDERRIAKSTTYVSMSD